MGRTRDGRARQVSHDEHLINSVCGELWVASGGTVTKSKGDFSDYKKMIGE